MDTDPGRPRPVPDAVFIPTFWLPRPRPRPRPRPPAPRHVPSIVEYARLSAPVVTDERLAYQAFVERRDPR